MHKLSKEGVDFLTNILNHVRTLYPDCQFMWCYLDEIGIYRLLVNAPEAIQESIKKAYGEDWDLTDVLEQKLDIDALNQEFDNTYHSWMSSHWDDCDQIKKGVDIIIAEVVTTVHTYAKGKLISSVIES